MAYSNRGAWHLVLSFALLGVDAPLGKGLHNNGVHASHVIVGIGMQLVLLLTSGKALGKLTPIKAASFY